MKQTEIVETENVSLRSEDYFQRMLINEREESEKSGHQFMLVLLDVGELLNEKWNEKETLLQELSGVLHTATREIDVKGWYLFNTLIGIIYPGYCKEDKDSAVEKLRQKIKSNLEFREAESIKIYTIFFSNIEEHNAPISETRLNMFPQLQDR